MTTVWLIRNDVFDEELESGRFISIGWDHIPDLDTVALTRDSLVPLLREDAPERSAQSLFAQAGIIRRFHDEVAVDDIVVAPHKSANLLRVGRVTGQYYHVGTEPKHQHRRPVEWMITDLRRDLLPAAVRQGLRNISTLSRIKREPDYFRTLVENPERSDRIEDIEAETPDTWLVGSSIAGEDQTSRFVSGGFWQLADGLDKRTSQMSVGDRIAIKSSYVRKHDIPFENRGINVSCMEIKARGVITRVAEDRALVDWDTQFKPREWYFYTNRNAVWRLNPAHRYTPDLKRFIFEGGDQDIDRFLADPFWARYAEAAETTEGIPSFRAVRPSAQPVYAAAEAWREALIAGNSLFSGEPLNYREAVAGLIHDFVERPLVGEGTFTGKLEEQLAETSEAGIQLAAELLFIYCLPIHHSGMGQAAKIELLRTVTSWRESVTMLPSEFRPPLLSGIARVGTAYHTYRWKVFQYLVLFIQAVTALSADDRREALGTREGFTRLTSTLDEQSVWAIRFLLEHLLFPDEAFATASRDDRVAMTAAFQRDSGISDVNQLVSQLPPNMRYGDRFEINPYTAPHRYEWSELGEERSLWGEWGALIIDDDSLVHSDEGAGITGIAGAIEALRLIATPAAQSLGTWCEANSHDAEALAAEVREHGLAWATDELATKTDWEGEPAEFVEVAMLLFSSIDPSVTLLTQSSISLLVTQLGNTGISPKPSPGELTIAVLEALDVLGVSLFETNGAELSRSALATLAVQIHELDPAMTPWPTRVQERFLDWRAGRGLYGPKDLSDEDGVYDADTLELSDPAPVAVEPETEPNVPQTLEELATQLTFDTEKGRKWLETTRELLHDKKQIILQGPPGTGKTYLAQKLALFLTGHSSRIKLVQFHPATSYEDFVEGYRPKTDGSGGFEVREGPLLQLARQAQSQPTEQHILIIDEINRANLPAVFGELYFLLEYRATPIGLTYGGTFEMPPNLFIIGTMNTADRSIASIDAALRRRFYIRDLRPEESPLKDALDRWLERNAGQLDWLSGLLTAANERIGDEDQHVGPSHFLRENLTEERARHAWDHIVLPTLREHFYGQQERLDALDFDSLKSHALKLKHDAEAD